MVFPGVGVALPSESGVAVMPSLLFPSPSHPSPNSVVGERSGVEGPLDPHTEKEDVIDSSQEATVGVMQAAKPPKSDCPDGNVTESPSSPYESPDSADTEVDIDSQDKAVDVDSSCC